ncbi:hypothetical protein PUN28_002263 [Cardiocondyla obscurior]
MASIGKRTLLRDINPHLICLLCRGYLIDATTVVECLHSFCRSCILKYLNTAAHCPSCKHAINKAKPNIKADKTLQEIVYKLVPGLYHKEMLKRREFYKKHPEHANSATPEQRGEDVSGRLIFNPEDVVSLSLEYLPPGADPLTILSTTDMDTNNSNSANTTNDNNSNCNGNIASRRYLQCPALVTVAHLKKFIAMKYSVDVTRYSIEICHRRATLPENWTLMDVAYIYAWKRIAPMRFFYRVAQEEQRLEAPLHQRPSTPGLGARDCLPPNEAQSNHLEISKLEIKPVDIVETTVKDLSNKIVNEEIISSVNCKQTITIEKHEADETTKTMPATSSTTTNITKPTTNASLSPETPTSLLTTCNDSNKQIKSPIKIMKNPDGRYEVLKSQPAAAVADARSPTSSNPEFSVVNSNGVKITLKQCSPPQNNNSKKPKIISNVLLRRGHIEKDTSQSSSALIIPQLQPHEDKEKSMMKSPILSSKQEKQRRKVTFTDRTPISEKTSPTTSVATPKTALKKPAEQQDKKQFLQGFQLTAREPSVVDDNKLKSPVRDINMALNTLNVKSFQKNNLKIEESSKKNSDEVKKKNNIENTGSNANNSTITTSMITKRVAGVPANSRTYAHKTEDVDRRPSNSGSGTSPHSVSIASGNHAAKADVYTFSSDPPIVPAGAVKRKCPPGVPIADLKRRKTSQIMQRQEAPINKKQNAPYNSVVNKLPRTSSAEHIVPINKSINMMGDHDAGSSRVSNVNSTKVSTGPLLSNDTRDLLVDGYGLNIPASLSITLTSPKSHVSSGPFVEPNDSSDNVRKAALGKVNPSITLNDCSVDPRVLKALKTGQIRMPSTPPKAKTTAATITKHTMATVTNDRGEIVNQQRTTATKRKKEHELSKDILDLSGGNRKVDIHPLRIPQPVSKLNKTNKVTTGRDNMQPAGISDQGQVVTLMGGHRYYRAPPGSLTPAAHRVNDMPLPSLSSRTPVYAPSFGIGRSNSDFASIFPSLPTYAQQQASTLQQFSIDTARFKLPPRSTTESAGTSGIGSGDNINASINSIAGKSHLAAQCAPVKPARSSVAPLAVPISKQPPTEKPTNVNVSRTVPVNSNKPLSFQNNEVLESTNKTCHVQKSYSLNVESTNNKLSRNDCAKNSDRTTSETSRDSSSESRSETISTENSAQQQEQQHREPMSPNVVSSTASPSPPPGNNSTNVRNSGSANNSDGNINSNDSNRSNSATSCQTKTTNSDVICNKSPDSPDSSSITVENSSKSSTTTDREISTDVQTSPNTTKALESPVNSDTNVVDDSIAAKDKNKLANKSEASEIAKQLSSVQKRLLAVFPSTEWANNPIAAEHLGKFLKSLNASIKNEEFPEGSKTEKSDQKVVGDDNDNKNR